MVLGVYHKPCPGLITLQYPSSRVINSLSSSASAVAAAAVTAKIQAMDAVATNLGVDASKLALPLVKPALPDPNLTTAVNPTADWRDRPVSWKSKRLSLVTNGWICSQIRKCGLPRDELGRPIKIMPGQGVQMGPKRPPGDRTPRY